MNYLKFFRLNANMTMEQVSEMTGIAKTTYSLIENGQLTASEQTVEKIANLFNVPKERLFYPVRFTIRELKEADLIG